MLTWNFDWQEILVGAVFSAIVSAITYKRFTRVCLKSLHPKKTLYLLFVHLPFFIKEMIKANLVVAYRALHLKMPAKPGIVETKVDLKSDLGKKPVTLQIPNKIIRFAAKRHRGFHANDWSKCVGCTSCARVCPTRVIDMVMVQGREDLFQE